MSKQTGTWKAVEREHAARLHSEAGRTGPTGLDLPDSISVRAGLAVESKCRKEIPDWLHEAMQQAVDNLIRYNGRQTDPAQRVHLPVVVLHQVGEPFYLDLVVMNLGDFQDAILPLLEAKRALPTQGS